MIYHIRKTAFTLAEVLITLGIIGIVAALLMPQVINGYKKHQTITQLKSNYSLFSQAIQSSIKDNGDIVNWNTSDSNLFLQNYLLPYINTVGEVRGRQYGLATNQSRKTSYLFWVPAWKNEDKSPCYFVKNGSYFCYVNAYNRLWITIDINGKKNPNVMGVDGFSFMIDPVTNRFIAADYRALGLNNEDKSALMEKCGEHDGTWIGAGCSGIIMIDGWQITNDYPYFK